MQPLVASARPLRRLGAFLLTLSVLVTSFGWAHLFCGAVTGHLGAAAAATSQPDVYPGMHPGMYPGMHIGMHSGTGAMLATDGASGTRIEVATEGASGDAGGPADHCARHGCPSSHSTSETDGCAMVTHCTAVVAPSAVAALMPAPHAAMRPSVPSAGRLLERAYQPDAPPPKA